MTRLFFGAALMPTSVLTVMAAAAAAAGLAAHGRAAWLFLGGAVAVAAGWFAERYLLEDERGPLALVGSAASRSYVLGHELTHAVASWSFGGKVVGIEVGERSGHVDITKSNAVVALAPYCVPFWTLVALASYRGMVWARPSWESPALFLVLMGGTIAFHLLKTFEAVWDVKQPDLPAAGGVIFSLSLILLINGLCVLLLLKALFPAAVGLGPSLGAVLARSKAFWLAAWGFIAPLKYSFLTQLQRA